MTQAERTDSNGKVWSDADISGMRFVAYGGAVSWNEASAIPPGTPASVTPPLEEVLRLTAEDYRDRYRMSVQEEAT